MRRAPRTHHADLGLRVSSPRLAGLGRAVWARRSEPLGWARVGNSCSTGSRRHGASRPISDRRAGRLQTQ